MIHSSWIGHRANWPGNGERTGAAEVDKQGVQRPPVAGPPAMAKRSALYEGKAKILYETDDPHWLVVSYKDSATAFDGRKRGVIAGKGAVNNQTSALFFGVLEAAGVPTHFGRLLGPNESLVRRVRIIPIEMVVRNIAAGSLAKRLGLEEGTPLKHPVVETYYKNDALGDPMVNEDHIRVMGWATPDQLQRMRELALRVNEVLSPLLERAGLRLVDFKLEFGVDSEGQVVLADEISPDTCRFWDIHSGERMDKDRFRRDLGRVEEAYQEVLRRLRAALDSPGHPAERENTCDGR